MATTKKNRPAAATRSRKPAPKSNGSAGKVFMLLLLAVISLGGGFALRQSGMFHGQIHHWLAAAHIPIAFIS